MSRRTDSASTVPLLDRLGLKLARLQPKVMQFESGPSATADAWKREDQATIAAAIGAYMRKPANHFPGLLLMMRLWPEGLNLEQADLVSRITNSLLEQRFRPTIGTMPTQVADRVREMLGGSLARQLLDEFKAPSPCHQCQGRGWIFKGDTIETTVKAVCPACKGMCEGYRPADVRARAAKMRAFHWRTHVQPVYERTLIGHRSLSEQAGQGVLKVLG